MKLPASDTRNMTGPIISSGCAARFIGLAAAMRACASGGLLRTMSVSMVPGASALTRMPNSAHSLRLRPRERHERGLGAAVHRLLRGREERTGRDHVDDGGVRARLQVRQRVLHQEHRAAEVDVVRLVPRVDGELAERLGEGVGRVVDHDVDAAEALDGGVDQRLQRIEVAHVGGARRALHRPWR